MSDRDRRDRDDLFSRAMDFNCSLIERNKILVAIRDQLELALQDIERRRLLANQDHETIAWYAEENRTLKAERDAAKAEVEEYKGYYNNAFATVLSHKAAEEELQRTFDLMWDADQRAIKRWQEAASPGEDRSFIWPDRSKLTEWLLNERDQAKKESAIAWSVCSSIHREYGKGRDPFYTTRQADFLKHESDCRQSLLLSLSK